MIGKLTTRLLIACLALLPGVGLLTGQQAEGSGDPKPAADAPPAQPDTESYDRPTRYPEIRFGSRPRQDGQQDEGREPLRSRVFLLDVSDAMSASITLENSMETTRMEHLRSLLEGGLDTLGRRYRTFNLITFGQVLDFARGGELLSSTAENTQRAKQWLKELRAEGRPDLHAILKECFAQGPDSAALLVGSMPARPEGASDDELQQAGGVNEYIIQAVRRYRSDGGKTTLDITGIGLNAEEKRFYRRLAEAGGGTYLDG